MIVIMWMIPPSLCCFLHFVVILPHIFFFMHTHAFRFYLSCSPHCTESDWNLSGILCSKNQVFETAHFDALAKDLRTKQAKGDPMIVQQTGLTVLANPHWGIVATPAWTVDVLWVYL